MSLHNPFAAFERHDVKPRPEAERIRVCAFFHKYPPYHNAGAEWMAHALLRDLVRRGHRVDVLVNRGGTGPEEFEGVAIDRFVNPVQEAAAKADVILTHLDMTRYGILAGHHFGKPIVHLLHNDRQIQFHRIREMDASLLIANSEWISKVYADWPGPFAVVHPPVEPDEYRVRVWDGHDRVTLMNLSEAKGGPLFWRLAQALPDRRFLAVLGAYARQEKPDRIPSNVMLVANTPDVVAEVYARTRILLMPSSYESWGRCAVEAACSGIPTIAHPTPGLVEALGTAAVWLDRDDDDAWIRAINRLFDDPVEYRSRSEAACARAAELDPRLGDYDRFEALVCSAVHGDLESNPHVR